MDIKSMDYAARAIRPYSAIIYAKDGLLIADDLRGGRIASNALGTGDSGTIQAAATAVGLGEIFLKSSPTEKITPTTKITVPPGVFFRSDGAKIDLSSINDIAFEWGNSTFRYADSLFSGISGVYVYGSAANTSCWLAKATNIARGVVFSDITVWNIHDCININGACYSASVKNVLASYIGGIFINIANTDQGAGYGPNATIIEHCELSNASVSDGGIGINIIASGPSPGKSADWTPNSVIVKDCWLEKLAECIHNEGYGTTVQNTTLAPSSSGIGLHIVRNANVLDSGNRTLLCDCPLIGSSLSGFGIKIESQYCNIQINNCIFQGFDSSDYGIYDVLGCYMSLQNCTFINHAVMIKAVQAIDAMTGNVFKRSANDNQGTAMDLTGGSYVPITSNVFWYVLNGIVGSPQACAISGNVIYPNTTTFTLGAGCIKKGNVNLADT
jgi:hypothetical protein